MGIEKSRVVRLVNKVGAGADFVYTQTVYEVAWFAVLHDIEKSLAITV